MTNENIRLVGIFILLVGWALKFWLGERPATSTPARQWVDKGLMTAGVALAIFSDFR